MPEVPPQIAGKVSFNVTLRHTYVVLGVLCELVVLQQYSFSVHTTNPPDPSSQTFWDARPGEHLFAPFTHPFAILPEFSMQQYGSFTPQVFRAPSNAHVSPFAVGNELEKIEGCDEG